MCLSCVWYLTEVNSTSGGTWIVPGSHRSDRNPFGPADGITRSAPIPGELQVRSLPLPPPANFWGTFPKFSSVSPEPVSANHGCFMHGHVERRAGVFTFRAGCGSGGLDIHAGHTLLALFADAEPLRPRSRRYGLQICPLVAQHARVFGESGWLPLA